MIFLSSWKLLYKCNSTLGHQKPGYPKKKWLYASSQIWQINSSAGSLTINSKANILNQINSLLSECYGFIVQIMSSLLFSFCSIELFLYHIQVRYSKRKATLIENRITNYDFFLSFLVIQNVICKLNLIQRKQAKKKVST